MTSADDAASKWLCVWRGIGLGNWLRLLLQGPSVDREHAGRLIALTLGAVRNSGWGLLESLLWRRRTNAAELHDSPLFILGHWRCGTTLLHQLFALDPQFAFVNQYQAMFPGHFLLTERRWTRRLAPLPSTRLVDQMALDWSTPQECETALMLMTLNSPYLSVAFPDRPENYQRFEDLKNGLSPRELQRWKESFLTLLKKISLRSTSNRFVLKSPTHTSRIPLLKQIFPNACYIYIVRNPYEVYASTLRLRRSMAELNGLSNKPPEHLEEQVLNGFMRMYQAYHMHRRQVDPARLCELRYEELVADPIGTMGQIYERFQLPAFDEQRQRMERWLPEHHRYRTSTNPLPEETRKLVYERWGPAFRRYGYPE